MAKHNDIDRFLREWPFEPGEVNARLVKASNGREVLQMRVDMGLLQLEVSDRPDGQRPGDADTYYDLLVSNALQEGEAFELTEERCGEVDREFIQFYHRRICWLSLREFRRAVRDADHTLMLMEFVREHSEDEDWILSHEQYRPFVLFHRTQASALAELEESGPEQAIGEINSGLQRMQDVYSQYGVEDRFDEDELVTRLNELKESLREHFHVGKTLAERLAEAVASEQFELAAKLRDELALRNRKRA